MTYATLWITSLVIGVMAITAVICILVIVLCSHQVVRTRPQSLSEREKFLQEYQTQWESFNHTEEI